MMNRKKVVLVENLGIDFYNSRMRYALHLKSLGYCVYAIVPQDGYINKIKSKGINVLSVSSNIRGTRILNKIYYAIELIKIFKSHSFDIVHTFRLQPNIICTFIGGIMTNSIIVNHITGLGTAFNYQSPKYKFLQYLTKFLYGFNNYFFKPISVFQNQNDAKDLGIEKNIFFVKGSSANEKRFNNCIPTNKIEAFKRKYKTINDDTVVFLFVSRLLKEKGIYELIEGFKLASKSNNIQLLIVGWFDANNKSSFNQDYLYDLIKDIDNIKFLGKQNDIPEIIALSDISILPSYYREGTPRFLLESMAMSKPIITTKMPGCDHLIQDNKNGILIEPRSIEAIEESINCILKQDFQAMGKKSYEIYCEQFSENVVFNSLSNIYEIKINENKNNITGLK